MKATKDGRNPRETFVDNLVQKINEMGSWFTKDNSKKLKKINRDIFFLKRFLNTLTLAEKSDSSGSAFFFHASWIIGTLG